MPDDSGLQQLYDIQSRLDGGRAVPRGELHVTVIHFGIYQEVLADLRRYDESVDEIAFQQALQQFLHDCEGIMPAQATFTPQTLTLFGKHQTVLAVEGNADAGLKELHAQCLGHLKSALRHVLHEAPEPFMEQSPNFRYALTFKPHITVVKSWHGTVPDITLPGDMRLAAMPLRYR